MVTVYVKVGILIGASELLFCFISGGLYPLEIFLDPIYSALDKVLAVHQQNMYYLHFTF